MHELNPVEIRRVAAAMYQPVPSSLQPDTGRNPYYHYLDATAPQQILTGVDVITI